MDCEHRWNLHKDMESHKAERVEEIMYSESQKLLIHTKTASFWLPNDTRN